MASMSFDVFSGDLVRALCSGAKLVLCPQALLLEAEGLYRLMRDEAVDCAEFVPAVAKNLVDYVGAHGEDFTFMKLLAVGSDTLYWQEFSELFDACGPQTRLVNSYGVSEATIDSAFFLAQGQRLQNPMVPIGRPMPNVRIHILDSRLRPVPIGVAGELHISGAGLSRGYLKRPRLTAEKFVPDPFAERAGSRLYRSGDLARYLPDGNIELLGRIDHQVKIRGFRIELREIESALAQHPSVREAVVLATEVKRGDRRLVAYVVGQPQTELEAGDLRRLLKRSLPDYMVPGSFVFLDSLPLTPNGKVDRDGLTAPEGRSTLGQTFVEPRTPEEEQLARIWADILRVERVGVEENFFELGGDSLLSVQVVARAREMGHLLTVRHLFEHQTVAELAGVASAKHARSRADAGQERCVSVGS
jgi:acyl-CoA synthetase (AMP-forming)/AMP-acid ligase II